MITTIFKIDLIEEAIGMKRLIRYKIKPTTTKVINTVIKGVIVLSLVQLKVIKNCTKFLRINQ